MKKPILVSILSSTIALSWASVAQAQSASADSAAAAADAAAGDIVVTAQKRAERLQDVPLAVTAVSADNLARQQINDTASLTRAVPSLTFQQGQGSQSNGFRIRGVGSQLFSLGVEASVSVVVDGVVAARAAQGFSDFADIERIEVLRGPQGTLFGKNATAGVVSIVTAKPSHTFGGSVEGTIAEKDEYRIKGTVTGPLSDTLAARISGYYNSVGGYIYNVKTQRNVNNNESWGIRGKLLWEPTDRLDFLLSGDYRKSEALCCRSVAVKTVTPTVNTLTSPVVASPANRQINDDSDSFNNENQYTISLEGNYDLGSVTLTSVTAWQRYRNDSNNVVDGIPNAQPVYTGANAQFNQNGGQISLDSFTQEVRLSSNGASDLTYVIGGFYSNTSVTRDFFRRVAACPGTNPVNVGLAVGTVCPAPAYSSIISHAVSDSESIAGFGQMEYRVVGGLKLLAGLRFQHETTAVTGYKITPAPLYPTDGTLFANNSGRRSVSDDVLTGKAGLKYEFHRNAQAYASYTRGYKGFGFNTEPATSFSGQNPVRPENVNAYEIGFKGRTADGVLSVSAAAFWSDYTDLQVLANQGTPDSPNFVQTNAGKSTTKGFELEGTLRPADALSIGFGLTYADSSVDAVGLACPLQNQASLLTVAPGATPPANTCYGTGSGQQNVVGGYLPFAPKWRINFAPRYEQDLTANLVGFVQANVNYQSRTFFALEQDPLLTQKPYALVDASIGVHDADNRYSVTVFVRNLFDQNYYSSMAHGSLLATATNAQDLTAYVNKDADRFFGATFGAKF